MTITNRKAMIVMTLALAVTWALAFGLDKLGVSDIWKLVMVITSAISGCMIGAFLFYIANRIYPSKKDPEPPP